MKLKTLLLSASIALLAPQAFAQEPAMSFKCDQLNILVYKQNDAKGRKVVTLNGTRQDDVKTSLSTRSGKKVSTVSFVERAQAGGSYGLYNLYIIRAEGVYLTNDWLDADDKPKREAKVYQCDYKGEIDAATPAQFTAWEARRNAEAMDARS
ncbi:MULTISPECIES: hypothetical protein [Serratia]|uniref:hypothetical protein n=1 Tax=Serratia TaxID=613 RepID=UPI00101F4127|nr:MULTISPECIES: hypothetical protein [Serratia]MBP1133546.1 hypothetical protein [Serratia sp. PL17]HBL7241987.1 hypothetical protein [Serratia liquefaciens]HDS5480600.1 hypothetical protein [Serratia liquefaciens]